MINQRELIIIMSILSGVMTWVRKMNYIQINNNNFFHVANGEIENHAVQLPHT